MELLLDENLSRRLVPFLQAEFPNSTHVALAGLERATDLAVWTHARDHGYVIVTRDADFEELSTIHGCPPRVIWIRGENMSKATILNLLLANRDVIEAALSEDGIACVELGSNVGRLETLQTPDFSQRGFTLIELAIVRFVVALLLGGMLLPLAAQQDIRNYADTQKILAEARDALLGFAMTNDRLPCPASATSNGVESFCLNPSDNCATVTTTVQSHGRCSNPYNGFLPAATLGFTPIDAQGYALDGWGGETLHRIRYAVSTNGPSSNNNSPPYQSDFSSTGAAFAFTYASGMKTISMTTLSPDLRICNTGAGMQNTGLRLAACAASASLANDAVAVVYSLGKNAGTGGAGTEENHNPNPQSTLAADRAFVNAAQGSAFDDQVLWLSKSTLFNRMVAAGKLP